MKALLVFPHIESVYGIPNYPPLGLAYLSSSLKKSDIEHEILDLRLYGGWKGKFLNKLGEDFDVVGITSTTFAFDKAQELAQIIKKKNPCCLVAVGGTHATLVKDWILKKDKNIDFVIVGEGEETFVELIKTLEYKKNLRNVRGLIFKDSGKIVINLPRMWNCELDKLPFPCYEEFDFNRYHGVTNIFTKKGILPILTSRGCPFECIYCSVYLTSGKKFRVRSAKNVVDEIEFMFKKYNVKIFDFLDDNFTLDIERAKQICNEIIKRDLKIKWSPPNGVRVDRIDENLVKLMKKSGCSGVALGVESIDDNVLKKLKKHITFEQIKKTVYLFKKYKIPIKAFFLVGSPGGSSQEVLNALKFAVKFGIKEARFSMLMPYPGTKLYEWVDKNNYWNVKNQDEAIIRYTHAGALKSLYEEPGFNSQDKMKVYGFVEKKWMEYENSRNFKLKFKRWVLRHKILYSFLSGLREKFKNIHV